MFVDRAGAFYGGVKVNALRNGAPAVMPFICTAPSWRLRVFAFSNHTSDLSFPRDSHRGGSSPVSDTGERTPNTRTSLLQLQTLNWFLSPAERGRQDSTSTHWVSASAPHAATHREHERGLNPAKTAPCAALQNSNPS